MGSRNAEFGRIEHGAEDVAHSGLRTGGEVGKIVHSAKGMVHGVLRTKVSGVSVQGMLLRQSFLTPETCHLKPNLRNRNWVKN